MFDMRAPTATHVIIGAGPVGTALAHLLVTEGESVRVLSRSVPAFGSVPFESVRVDASDPEALSEVTSGAEVIYNCANPGPYPVWEAQWPPLATSILSAAERSGAVLVTASNLYGYGRVTAPITRSTPLDPCDHKGELRARMWQEALDAHRAGRVRVTEARSSDYIGPRVSESSGLIMLYAALALTGKTVRVLADPDQPHTWTAVADVAATLAALGREERAWGSAWIVPSNPPRTVRQVLEGLTAAASLPMPRVTRLPRPLLKAAGLMVPMVKELSGVLHQFDEPFVADGSETAELVGVRPTPWEHVLGATAEAFRP